MNIQAKIIVPVFATMILLVAFIFVFVTTYTTNMANDLSDARILGAAQTARAHLAGLEVQSRVVATAVSSNPYFISLFLERNMDEMLVFLRGQKELFGLDGIVVTDADASVLLRSHDPGRYGDFADDSPGIRRALRGEHNSLFISNPSFPVGLSSVVPIYCPQHGQVIGSVAANHNLTDYSYADEFAAMFNAEVAFFAGRVPVAYSFRNAYGQRYFGRGAPPPVATAVLELGLEMSTHEEFHGEAFHIFLFPLPGEPGDHAVGMFFIGFSREDVNASLARMQILVVHIGVFSLIVTLTFLLFTLLRFLRPLDALTRNVLELSDDYSESATLYGGNRKDEVGELSRNISQMRTKLMTLTQSAQAASESKGHFLSNMSHEIRTPMNAISNMVVIGSSAPEAHKKQYALDKIGTASSHLLGVINDVLDISKIEAKKFELHRSTFNFRQVVEETIEVVRYPANEKNLQLALTIAPGVPRYVMGDTQRFVQVLTNLLSNAIKFTPPEGKIGVNISVGSETDESVLIVTNVADTGIGMTREQQRRVFNLFEQAEASTARNYGGTGLGLTISKQIAVLMGGDIAVRSETGVGSTFTLTTRFALANEDSYSLLEEARIANIEDATFEGKTALLAEDIDINREVVQALLADTRLHIECAHDGAQAVEMYKTNPARYDLIFMDVQMPIMNGYEATRQIRAAQPPGVHIPVIAMTANVFREEVEKCLDAGMDDHIGKPIDRAVVVEKLVRWLVRP